MIKLKKLVLIIAAVLLFRSLLSCGIEEYFYLPQVPDTYITRIMNTDASIIIPSVPSEFYYFTNYVIYYKIYKGTSRLSDSPLDNYQNFSTELRNDYNALSSYTDPTNYAYSTSIDTVFNTRGYYELFFSGRNNNSMFPQGGTLRITFPTGGDPPYATLNNADIILNRNLDAAPAPEDRQFVFSYDLINTEDSNRNTDVTRASGEYVCVSMYIVAEGYDSNLWKPIYGKPTHIHFFTFAY